MESTKKDIMIVNIIYFKPQKINGEWYGDCMLVVYKENGIKKFSVIDDPTFSFYTTKEEFREEKDFNEFASLIYVTSEKLKKVSCSYSKLLDTILANLPKEESDYYKEQLKDGASRYKILNALHNSKMVHGTDINIEDHYFYKTQKKYGVTEQTPSKAFFDIEVNGIGMDHFASESEAAGPVSHITLYFEGKVYTFLKKFKNIPESMKLNAEVLESYKAEILKRQGQYGVTDVEFFLYEENEELKMIKEYFNFVNNLKPDIICAWNMKFDIRYLLNRVSVLFSVPLEEESSYKAKQNFGNTEYNFFSKAARQLFLPKEFRGMDHVMYAVDLNTRGSADNSSYFKSASFSTYIDMLVVYENMTKSAKKDSYALDSIAAEELGDHKDSILDEHGSELSMADFLKKRYREFTMYNVHDVLLIKRIDEATKFQDIVWGVSQITGTRIHKAMKKTVCLRNFANIKFEDNGYILSNNRNASFSHEEDNGKKEIVGAFVADPNNMLPVGKELVSETLSKFVFDNVIDEDLVSMYPKIIYAFNIDHSLQLGKILPPTNRPDITNDDIVAGCYSRDFIKLGSQLLGLPTLEEVLYKIKNPTEEVLQ
jgi:DNA polymerase elongation subunit (family B)